jgi:hypothetical protein
MVAAAMSSQARSGFPEILSRSRSPSERMSLSCVIPVWAKFRRRSRSSVAIGAIDCSDLAAGLESGVTDLMGDSGDACSELFGCGTEDDLEALFDNERVGSSGD